MLLPASADTLTGGCDVRLAVRTGVKPNTGSIPVHQFIKLGVFGDGGTG
jgi:hypothetical protein